VDIRQAIFTLRNAPPLTKEENDALWAEHHRETEEWFLRSAIRDGFYDVQMWFQWRDKGWAWEQHMDERIER
jgi:hypothetical protein